MTLATDMLRITTKDVRVLHRPLLGWCALLGVSVLRGLGVLGGLGDALFPVTALVPAAATVLVALAVASDPATDGPTFWGVHRQRPLAVAGAKAIFASLLLALMTAGHAIVLASHDVRAGGVATLAIEAARETGAWLLFAAAMGAGMRDARGWVTGAGIVTVGCVLLAQLLGDPTSWRSSWPLSRGAASLLLLTCSLAVLAWTYRRRLAGVHAPVRTAVLTAAAALALVTPSDSVAIASSEARLARDTALVVHGERATARLERGAVVVEIPLTHPDSSRVVGAAVAWSLRLEDGSVVHILPGGARVRRTATRERLPDVLPTWGRGAVTHTLTFRHPLDSATHARVAGKLARVALALEVDRLAMRPIAAFPARTGGVVAHDGRRLRVSGLGADGRVEAAISRVWVAGGDRHIPPTIAFAAEPVLTYRHPGSGAAVVLRGEPRALSGGVAPSWVLPGNAIQAWSAALEAPGVRATGSGELTALAGTYAGRVAQRLEVAVVR